MTEDQNVAPSSLDNVSDQFYDQSAGVQMKDPVINDPESQVSNLEKVILPKMGEPQDLPDTIESRNISNCVPRCCGPGGIYMIEMLTDDLETWATRHKDLKHLITDDLDTPVTPLYWLDTIISKLSFYANWGKFIKAWETNDRAGMKKALKNQMDNAVIPQEERDSLVGLLCLKYISIIKFTFNGTKFGIDDESTFQISASETFPELRNVFEGLEKHYVQHSIPRKLFCFMDISRATSYANHSNFIDYVGSFLTKLRTIKQQYKQTSEEMMDLLGLYLVMQESTAFENNNEFYELFKEFLRADDISHNGLKQAAKAYGHISFKKRTDDKKQNFFVLRNGELVKIRCNEYLSFEEFSEKYSSGGNQGGASNATSALKKSKTKGFRDKSKKNKKLVIKPCRRCSGQSHPFGQHIEK